MALFSRSKTTGLMDEIRCDEPSYLIWKWHPAGSQSGANKRENAIRYGSSLRVKEGEVAVFVYNQSNGVMQDFIEGPCDQIIETNNLPVLASIIGLAYGGGSPFQAEIYFINLARIIQVKFGVPFFDVYDPRFDDFGVPVAVRGTISFQIEDYRRFIKLHRLTNFDLDDFQRQIRDTVIRYVKDAVANAPAANNIPLVQIETKIAQINDIIEYDIAERLKDSFGVLVSGVDINAIELDKDSDGYRQLVAVTRNMESLKIQAQTEDYVEKLRIQREEDQYAMHKQTQSSNIGAFQAEKQAEVGVAGAEALGKMGGSGSGNIDSDGGRDGFNMAAMMTGMAVGSSVGQNIAGTINNMMPGTMQPQMNVSPPPIPMTAYYIAENGTAKGPFNEIILKQMIAAGQITFNTLVWKAGMSEWQRSGTISELRPLFSDIPPIPPTE